MQAALAGFFLGLSLIVAIGAQNAFVLRQGLRGEHVFWICLTCAVSDAILILAGVTGFASLVERFTWLPTVMRYAGAAFLLFYGARSAISAYKGGAGLGPSDATRRPLLSTLGVCLALTWLNPHVYLDTVVLLGSVSTGYSGELPQFAGGAMSASVFFFFSLGYGAAVLRPVFARSRSWQVLDACIAMTMWVIALNLLVG